MYNVLFTEDQIMILDNIFVLWVVIKFSGYDFEAKSIQY